MTHCVVIRGTNGSGKSTIVRNILHKFPYQRIYGLTGPKRPEAYAVDVTGVKKPVYILGTYERPVGGVDNIIPYELMLDVVAKYVPENNVVLEGLIISSVYGRLMAYLEQFKDRITIGFMDTPLDVCIKNVEKRRIAAGDMRPYDPHHLLRLNGRNVSVRKRIVLNGFRVEDISMKNGTEKVLSWLKG